MSFRIIELLSRNSQPVFTARKPSFTNNFTKRQILGNSVFSIFPTSEASRNFPGENSIRKWSVSCVAGVETGRGLKNRVFTFRFPALYRDGSAHALFPRQIVVDPLAEISFRATGISSACLLIQTRQKFYKDTRHEPSQNDKAGKPG